MRWIDRVAHGVAALCMGLAALLTAAIAVAVIYTVAARFAFNRTPAWTEELPRILMIWAVYLGIVWTTAKGSNLEAGLLDLWASGARLRAAMRLLAEILVAAFCVTLAMTAAEMADITWFTITPALELTAAIFYLPIAIGGALAALCQVPRILRQALLLAGRA